MIPAASDQPICWEDIECGLVEWVCAALELDSDHVVWANQKIAQPDYPYVMLLIIAGPTKVGGVDEIINIFDDSAEASAARTEITRVNVAPVEFTLQATTYVDQEACLNVGRLGVPLAARLQASLGQISTREGLAQNGLSIVREEGVTDVSQEVNGRWVSAANLDVIFRTTHILTDQTTFIERVQITSEDFNIDETVPEA